MKDFFISYSHADTAWAEWIAWQLEAAGWTTAIQAWDFRPGANFVLEINRATKEARRLLAVLSPAYLASLFTAPEWAAYFARDSTGAGATIVPVRVADCEIGGLLGPIVYIDLVGLEPEAASKALLAGVGKHRAKPRTPPKFPGSRGSRNPDSIADDDGGNFQTTLVRLLESAAGGYQTLQRLKTSKVPLPKDSWYVEPLLPGVIEAYVAQTFSGARYLHCEFLDRGSIERAEALFAFVAAQIRLALDESWVVNERRSWPFRDRKLEAVNGLSGLEIYLQLTSIDEGSMVAAIVPKIASVWLLIHNV